MAFDLDAWRAKLFRGGHEIVGPNAALDFTVRPTPDVIVIVLDAEDSPEAPRRFVCEAAPEPVLALMECPAAHQNRWLTLVKGIDYEVAEYLSGPGSWTLARLARFPEIVLWADAGLGAYNSIDEVGWGLELPDDAKPFLVGESGEASQLGVVRVHQAGFADVVAACFIAAFEFGRDCYLADTTGSEVYYVSNDSMVFASIADVDQRRELLTQLERFPWPFRNASR